ncbi:histidine kinase [Humibacter sp.]|uniref:histidine kinase n=1 Tax=Humibacter sp. TaxID=1940291 RepID=UPI003F7E2A12
MEELFARLPIRADVSPVVARWSRGVIPVAAAVMYLVLWIIAEAGRTPLLPKVVMFSLWAIALGLVGIAPRIALWGTVAIPLAVLGAGIYATAQYPVGGDFPFDVVPMAGWAFSLSTTWPAWFAAPIIVGYVATTSEGRAHKRRALLIGIVSAVVYAVILILGGWLSWTGYVSEGLSGLVSDCIVLVFGLVLAVIVAWLLGVGLVAMRRVGVVADRLQATTEQLDEADVELRLAHDRGRISRDIHDSLAHSLAIIVAQADGAAAIQETKPDALPESLTTISTVARAALGEVRRLVERINDEDDVDEHRSRIEHINALIEDVRAAGLDATLRVLGDLESIGLSKQVAVYRIVQESLTNALKHAGRDAAVTVTLDGQGAGLAVLVVSSCNGGRPLVSGGSRGIGIAGMKERARLVGGWLTAMPSDDETFVVTAFIPSDAARQLAIEAADG